MKRNYADIFNYIRGTKNHIYFILTIFILSFLIGYFFPIFFVDNISGFIKKLIEQTRDLGGLSLIFFIFKNNFIVSFSSILLGLVLGIMPIILSLMNGYVLGFVAGFAVSQEGILVLWNLVPHGIFELPAIILSLALGLRLGLVIFNQNFKKEFKFCLVNTFWVFILLIVPLLVIAAIIEGILVGAIA